MTVFVILNEVLRQAGHECACTDAALVEVEGLLPPEGLEQGLCLTRCLLHRGEEAEALLMAEALILGFPDRAECHFNAGCARQRLGDGAEALAHYERCLALHPHFSDAWLNRGVMLRKLGRLEEARFCNARLRQAGGDQAPAASSPRLLCETPGTFDILRVFEDEDLRALFIGEQCQGAMYRQADDGGAEPGPFAWSPFTTGWLVPGYHHASGHGLMLGLGCGAGAVFLLTCFPELRLRVVEIDDKLIALALRLFPRLAQLCRSGRLEIVHADAREVVSSAPTMATPPYDFVLLDLFSGNPEPPPLLHDSTFIANLSACARQLWANAIFTLGGAEQQTWLDRLKLGGRPIARMYPTTGPEQWSTQPNNWILSTNPAPPPKSFQPFATSSHFLAEAVRNDFRAMCARTITLGPVGDECAAPPPTMAGIHNAGVDARLTP